MGGRSIGKQEDLLDMIKKLENRVRNLERTRQLGNSSVDTGNVVVNNGQITAKHPNGTELFRTGVGQTILPFATLPTDGYVTRITRASGVKVFETFSSNDGTEAKSQFNDRQGNEIVGDDWLTGRGLSRPWLSWRFYPVSEWFTPPQVVTSATYVDVFNVVGQIQNPAIYMNVRVVADAGTTGNVRLYDSFFAYALWTQAISSGFNGNIEQTANVSGLRNYGDNCTLVLQAQRTAGTGNIRIGVELVYGRSATTI